jgi:hypothetical protein
MKSSKNWTKIFIPTLSFARLASGNSRSQWLFGVLRINQKQLQSVLFA